MAKKIFHTSIEQKVQTTIDNPSSSALAFAPKADQDYYIKNAIGEEYKVLSTKHRRNSVRAAGSTDDSIVTETGIREAITAAVPSDFIPNFFVTDLSGFLDAYNTIRSSYAGGNIYVVGDIIMTADLTLDLTGITIIGSNCNWRFYNDVFLNPTTVRKIVITAGSPTFSGIRFWGSNGQSTIDLSAGTTRHIFDITPSDTSKNMFILFDNCEFLDVVCGGEFSAVITCNVNLSANASLNLSFDNCRVGTHSASTGINYTGFQILHDYLSTNTTHINVNVINQRPSPLYELYNSSSLFVFRTKDPSTTFSFNSDETAFLDGQTPINNLTRTNTILTAATASVNQHTDYILISKGDGLKNIRKASATEFQKQLKLDEYTLLGRGQGIGYPETIKVGTGLNIDANKTLNCTASGSSLSSYTALLNSSVLLNSLSWINVNTYFGNSILLEAGVYLINAQANFTRGYSKITKVGFKITVGGTSVTAAEDDFNLNSTLHASAIVTVPSRSQVIMYVYASISGEVSLVGSTMGAPSSAGPTTQINVVKIR